MYVRDFHLTLTTLKHVYVCLAEMTQGQDVRDAEALESDMIGLEKDVARQPSAAAASQPLAGQSVHAQVSSCQYLQC